MKANYMFRIFIILGMTIVMSCGSEKSSLDQKGASPRIRKFSKVKSPKNNTKFKIGESIPFSLESSREIDSITLEYRGNTERYKSVDFTWPATKTQTGDQKIRLTVYGSGTTETHYVKVKFLSDIEPAPYTYELLKSLPHDASAYTQGLFFLGDTLVESTGRRGESKLSKLNLTTSTPYTSISIGNQYFGEGSTIWHNRIVMLTWTSGVGFVFDRNLQETETFSYSHQGWGITTHGDTLLISDGTETIHKVDPRDFSEIGKLQVYDHKNKISDLNELEMIDGYIYANVYQQNLIVVIDPKTGKLLRKINMSGLTNQFDASKADVLNGIAYHASSNHIYVTGKLWPHLFQVKFIPKNP